MTFLPSHNTASTACRALIVQYPNCILKIIGSQAPIHPKVVRMAQNIEAAAPVWKTSIIAATILGGILFIGGIILAILGSSAESTFTLFGNEFSSTSVGVALAFIGAVLDIIIIQRVLTSVDAASKGKGMSRPGDPEAKKPGTAR